MKIDEIYKERIRNISCENCPYEKCDGRSCKWQDKVEQEYDEDVDYAIDVAMGK